MNYRKLTESEIKEIVLSLVGFFDKVSENKYSEIVKHIKKYYPAEACFGILTVQSEYNDNWYNNTPQYLAVYNAKKEEILPIAVTAKQCRKEWPNFEIHGDREGNETSEPMEDIVVYVSRPELPTLYIKE